MTHNLEVTGSSPVWSTKENRKAVLFLFSHHLYPSPFISTVYESCVKIIRTVEMVKCDKSDKRQNDKSHFRDSGF